MGDLRPPHLPGLPDGSDDTRGVIDRNFIRIKDFLRDMLNRAQWLDGRLVEDVSLSAGATTQVEHKLNRQYRGFFVLKGTVNADYPGEGTSDDGTKFLALTVTGAQTVDLWVF